MRRYRISSLTRFVSSSLNCVSCSGSPRVATIVYLKYSYPALITLRMNNQRFNLAIGNNHINCCFCSIYNNTTFSEPSSYFRIRSSLAGFFGTPPIYETFSSWPSSKSHEEGQSVHYLLFFLIILSNAFLTAFFISPVVRHVAQLAHVSYFWSSSAIPIGEPDFIFTDMSTL